MTPEEFFDLEAAKNMAMQSQQDINDLFDGLHAHALKLITEIYADDLLTMESKGFMDIKDMLSIHLTRVAGDADDIIYRNQIKEKD